MSDHHDLTASRSDPINYLAT